MFHPVKEIKMVCTDHRETAFHIEGREIVPYTNFNLAQNWYFARRLTPKCKTAMEWILKNRLLYFG